MSNSYFSKSLEKGLRVLSLFNREQPALTQTEIAHKLGLNMTSTYRYISTLVDMGFLEKDGITKQITPSIYCLAFCNNLMHATDHRKIIKVLVDEIHSRFNITIDVALSVDDDMMRIYNRQASDMMTFNLPDFTRNCLHNTALGKAYLSTLPLDELKNRIKKLQLTSRTAHTVVNRKALLEELKQTKEQNFALNCEEYLPGLIAIAAPIVDPHKNRGIGAVSFDFSTIQRGVEEIKEQFAPIIIDLANKISSIIPVDYRNFD